MDLNRTEPLHNIASPTLDPFLIGLGCSKKISAHDILATLQQILYQYQGYAYSLALPEFKRHDPNIIQLQQLVSYPLILIPNEILKKLQPQCQSFSETAYRLTGLGSIAEACLRASMNQQDHLLVPKTIYNGITISLAQKGL